MTKVSLLFSIFFQRLRNLGNIAKIFLHALSISEKYSMISFLALEGSAEEWRWWSIVTCMPLRHYMLPTGVLRLSKWHTIKAFHTGVELRQECVLFFLFFIVYMSWIDKCNQVDECATTGNWKISCLLCAVELILLSQNLASAHIK